MTKKRVLFCGSRTWKDRQTIRHYLEKLAEEAGVENVVVVHGAAMGADSIAGEIAKELGFEVEAHPADWSKGKGAGFARNIEMLESGVEFVYAFTHGTNGTQHTIEEARKRHIPGLAVGTVKKREQ